MPRPAPVLTADNEAFWAAASEHRLVAQRCAGCGRLHHPPRPMCPACHSLSHDMVELSGNGVVYSYALLHHPQHPAFSYPVVAALIELDEGVRVVSNLVHVEPADVVVGMPVRVLFEDTADGGAAPVFEPRVGER